MQTKLINKYLKKNNLYIFSSYKPLNFMSFNKGKVPNNYEILKINRNVQAKDIKDAFHKLGKNI